MNDALPRHVAIIMDGNGRWAAARGLSRTRGHAAGVESVRAVTRTCARKGLAQLTLYAFSEENWKRPKREVALLMRLLRRFLVRERKEIMDNDIRLTAIGRLHRLPADVRRELEKTRELSAGNGGMVLNLALSYGGRQEILDAVRAIGHRVRSGELDPDEITEETITAHLYQPDMPPPDLLIRTAGEMRFSNFLLWQVSYTELHVTQSCWPEFREEHLDEAFESYARRVRKFGGLVPGTASG
ncbi:MAG TPA: isoprenyl transferase [Planctomycetota bacterium]|nr:isoprenyl transferase [Planctomycetota bacterium]